MSKHHAGGLAVQAFIAEWGAGHVGVSWSDPEAPVLSTADVARRLGRGALAGTVTVAGLVLLGWLTGAVTLGRTAPSPSALGVGLVVAMFSTVRDELLLRGVVLRAFRHTLGTVAQLVVCGVMAAASRVGQQGDEPLGALLGSRAGALSTVVAALGGVCLGTIWLRERGAWMACGAHLAWTFLTTTVIAGGLCSATWGAARGSEMWGSGGADGSLVAALALALATAAASVWYRRRAGRS